jgi:hypothetical protein
VSAAHVGFRPTRKVRRDQCLAHPLWLFCRLRREVCLGTQRAPNPRYDAGDRSDLAGGLASPIALDNIRRSGQERRLTPELTSQAPLVGREGPGADRQRMIPLPYRRSN